MRETIVPQKNLTTVEIDSLAPDFGLQHPAAYGVKLVRDFHGFDSVSLWEAMVTLSGDEKARADRAGGTKS